MAAATVFESSEAFVSPGGVYRATVSSQTTRRGKGLSQAMVSGADQGTGLVAFDLPRVSMSFAWRGDHHLTVRYPNDLPPPDIDATNTSFGRGGKGRVIYKAVPTRDIRPLLWARSGELRVVATQSLKRGRLHTIEMDGQVEYSYAYYDVRERDSSTKVLLARGLQGGGDSWAGIIHGLVALRAPTIADDLDFDPESDGLAVRSTNRAALVTVAKLVAAAKSDQALLVAAIERARLDGEME